MSRINPREGYVKLRPSRNQLSTNRLLVSALIKQNIKGDRSTAPILLRRSFLFVVLGVFVRTLDAFMSNGISVSEIITGSLNQINLDAFASQMNSRSELTSQPHQYDVVMYYEFPR